MSKNFHFEATSALDTRETFKLLIIGVVIITIGYYKSFGFETQFWFIYKRLVVNRLVVNRLVVNRLVVKRLMVNSV